MRLDAKLGSFGESLIRLILGIKVFLRFTDDYKKFLRILEYDVGYALIMNGLKKSSLVYYIECATEDDRGGKF